MKKALHIALFSLLSSSLFSQYAWTNVGPGTNFTVQSLAADPASNLLYVGGIFTQAGTIPAIGIAKWDGVSYSGLGQGITVGTGVSSLLVRPNGNVVGGGTFITIDGVSAKNIAEWNGATWSPLGLGLDTLGATTIIKALAIYNNELYAGGIFNKSGSTVLNYIAKWDGANWQPVGTGMNGVVSSLCVYNSELYAGGTFTSAGGVAVKNIAKWDGLNWGDVGGGCDYTGAISVSALQVYGGDLYAGGTFNTAGITAVKNIAKWDGLNWGDVGGGCDYTGAISVSAFTIYHGELVVGGSFDTLGVAAANKIGSWNGSTWSTFGTGMNNAVYATQALGDTLYAGGTFTTSGGTTTLFISQWQPSLTSVSGSALYQNDYMNLYPNPVKNKIFISTKTTMNHNKTISFTLFDAMGRELLKREKVTNEISFESEPIAPGLYFYKITDADKTILKEGKIIFAE